MSRQSRYIPKHVKDAVRRRDRDRCRLCGQTSEYMEFDHITPHSYGAPATVDNIQQLCRKCNIAKRNKTAHCPYCGIWIPHNAQFCQRCGKRLNNIPEAYTVKQSPSFDFDGVVRLLRKAAALVLLFVGILILLGAIRC